MNNTIHIKLEYDEAVEAKKEILSSEIELIRIMKIIRKYNDLRHEELRLKMRLKRKSTELLREIRRIQGSLPELEIPESVKKIERKYPPLKKENKEFNLEAELRGIQEKLNSLQKK